MKNRIALWDNLKFFLVTCVVIGHFADQFTDVSKIYDSIFLFIYSFLLNSFKLSSFALCARAMISSKFPAQRGKAKSKTAKIFLKFFPSRKFFLSFYRSYIPTQRAQARQVG